MGSSDVGSAETGFRPPLLAGRYVVHVRLGRGATSGVYLVFDLTLKAWRAAKVMHPTQASDPELRERFAREAVVMARLDHSNVVRVVDVAPDVALPYLVMELLEGGSAVRYLKSHGPMPPAQAVRVAVQVCQGLSALHALGGVHRDVKPQNLLFERSGRCKITDFGTARLGPGSGRGEVRDELDGHITEVGTVMGTAAYMAPEQAVDASSVDSRADVFGVGATLFTLLTATSATDLSVIRIDDPRLAGVPEGLAHAMIKACAYRANDRYSSIRGFAKALKGLDLPPVPVDAPPLALDAPKLPTAPATRLGPDEVRGLTELISAGVIRTTYDPSGRATGPSITPRNRRPLDPPSADDQTVLRRRVSQWEHQTPEAAPRSSELRTPSPPPSMKIKTREPVEERVERGAPRIDLRVVVVGMGLVLLVCGALAAVGSVVVANGARDVGDAERLARGTEDRMFVLIDHNQPVVSELGEVGANREQLEEALQNFLVASPEQRSHDAEVYLALVTRAHTRASGSGARIAPATHSAMSDLSEAWTAHRDAMAAWDASAHAPSGVVAIRLGLASAPNPKGPK